MRRLTASQRIAQLHKRIEKLEKEAGVFDSFSAEVLKSAAQQILDLLIEQEHIAPKSNKIRYNQRGKSQTAFVVGSLKSGIPFKLIVRKSRNRLVAFVSSLGEKVVLGNTEFFQMDSQASVNALLDQAMESIVRKNIVLAQFFEGEAL